MCPTRRLSPKQTTACLHFHCAAGFATQRLARMLHSLVRVSRRVGCSHLITNNYSARCDRSPVRASIRPQTLHAVPEAVPKRPEAAQTRRPALPVILSHPQTSRLPGYKSHSEEWAPTRAALVSHGQLLLASLPKSAEELTAIRSAKPIGFCGPASLINVTPELGQC